MGVRRLPVYILVDTSGSMRGEPIHALNVGLKTMEQALRRDPYALDSVYLSLITFDNQARELFPLTPLEQVQIPEISVPNSGATFLGAALELALKDIDRNVRTGTADQRGDWRPLLFVMTDGSPSDTLVYRQMAAEVRRRPFGQVVACAAGPRAKTEPLRQLTDTIVALDTLDGTGFSQFFQWVSQSIASGDRSAATATTDQLPALPDELHVVL